MPTPRSRRRLITTISRRTSASASAAVGSSMISTRAFWLSALAISTRWRLATERVPTLTSTSRSWLSSESSSCRERRRISPQSSRPIPSLRRVAEEDVLGDGQLGKEQQLLVDGGDAAGRGVARGDRLQRLVADVDGAAVRRVGAGDDLDQRRLAGAVLAEQRVHLAGLHVEVDVLQHADAAEGLRHAFEPHQRRHRHPSPGPSCCRARPEPRLHGSAPASTSIPPGQPPGRNIFLAESQQMGRGSGPPTVAQEKTAPKRGFQQIGPRGRRQPWRALNRRWVLLIT